MLKQRILRLSKIAGLDLGILTQFSDLGIDSAEELVALAATPGGLQRIAKFLGVDENTVKVLIETARKGLPAELRDQMSKPSELPVSFGARIPKRRKQFEAELAIGYHTSNCCI